MDELLKTVITSLPNFIGLVLAIYILSEKMVTPLLGQQQKFLDMMMELLRECKKDLHEIRKSTANTTDERKQIDSK